MAAGASIKVSLRDSDSYISTYGESADLALDNEMLDAVNGENTRGSTVAQKLAKKAQEKNITKIYFDRGSYKYHGRIKAFADTLRENGMEF